MIVVAGTFLSTLHKRDCLVSGSFPSQQSFNKTAVDAASILFTENGRPAILYLLQMLPLSTQIVTPCHIAHHVVFVLNQSGCR